MDIKTIKQKVLKTIDKAAVAVHKKIAGPKDFITIYFSSGSKEILEAENRVWRNHEIVVEIPKKYADIKTKDPGYFDINCKFKVGDGVTNYKDLKYHYGTIPPVIEQTLDEELWIL